MLLGAYQFAVSDDISWNMRVIRGAVSQAMERGVSLLAFPECALTGYPEGGASSRDIDFSVVEACFLELRELSTKCGVHLLVGSATREGEIIRNTASLFLPGEREPFLYHKRALWGWDVPNFAEGEPGGVWDVGGFRMGARICFEVRFPEYFRELYRAKADFAVVLFHDVSEVDDVARYELIKAHLRTRSTENVFPVLSVNSTGPYQTAPTAAFDENGFVVAELPRDAEGLLLYEFRTPEEFFGARGRRTLSDKLTGRA